MLILTRRPGERVVIGDEILVTVMGVSGHTAMTHTLPRAGLVLLPYPDPYRGDFSADEVLRLLDHQFATSCPPRWPG